MTQERSRYTVRIHDDLIEVELLPDPDPPSPLTPKRGGGFRALVNGEELAVRLQKREGSRGLYTLTFTFTLTLTPTQDDRSVTLWIGGQGRHYEVLWRGRSFPLTVEPARVFTLRDRFRGRDTATDRDTEEIRAVMPGRVVQVGVQEGQRVRPGDGLLVISAMKMENEIRAPRAGVVQSVHVKEGQEVRQGELLCVIRYEREPTQ